MREVERFRERLEERPFRPPLWLRAGHLQTIGGYLARRRFEWGWRDCRQQLIELPDGARLQIQLVITDPAAPTLVAVHGMGGDSSSLYMQALSHKAYRQGWNAVLLNLYNRNYQLPRPRIFHAGASRDLGHILERLEQSLGLGNFFLVGVSMGANLLLRLLGEEAANMAERVRAAAVLSPLVDLTVSWQMLERPSNILFQSYFVGRFKRMIAERAELLRGFVDLEAIRRMRTIRQFDELVTAPLGGFENAMEYYRKASARPLADRIRVPTLVVHSRDDPLLPWQPVWDGPFRSNPCLLVHLTRKGGHVGFIEADSGGDLDRFWGENRALEFFQQFAVRGRVAKIFVHPPGGSF